MRPLLGKRLQDRITLGIMSGTSLDGVDLSLVRFTRDFKTAEHRSGFSKFPYSLRKSLFDLASTAEVSKDELLSADRKLGLFYLRSAKDFLQSLGVKTGSIDLVGCHGQTVHHRAAGGGKSGRNSVTLQIGSPDVVAQGLGVPVVSDFRAADVAAGGRGAPLTPIAHFHLFSVPRQHRLIVNIGGISNATYLPGSSRLTNIRASDCGPGNMLIDQLCLRLFGKSYDKNGKIAGKGYESKELLSLLMQMGFLRRKLPMALGREQFGNEIVDQIMQCADSIGLEKNTVVSTVTRFTALCIARVARRFGVADRILICGGGAHNPFLLDSLREMFSGSKVTDCSVAGVDPDFVESVSFALLANLAIDRIPGNLPQVTGAAKPVVLGKVTLV